MNEKGASIEEILEYSKLTICLEEQKGLATDNFWLTDRPAP
jgi:hypothetical protein